MNDHISMLRHMREWRAVCDSERAAIDAAIRALSADRGEAVGEVFNECGANWIRWANGQDHGLPAGTKLYAEDGGAITTGCTVTMRQLSCRETVPEATPPSPAESAEGVLGYIGAGVAVNLFTGYSVTTTITPHKAMLDDVAIYQRPAAPSQVSDAMVERACAGYMRCRFPECDWPADWGPTTQAEIRQELRAALEAAQPQPGRVEGMVLVPREPTRSMMRAGARRWIEAAEDAQTIEDEYQAARCAWAAMIATASREAAAPTAGGDA